MDVECLVMTHFENILEAVARVRRLFKLKMCLHFVILPELWLVKMEETHVSAHMLFVKSLIFIHNPCYYLVSRPVFSKYIFYLFLDSCSAYKFFEARFILIYNADVLCLCKFFESCRSVQLVFKKLMDLFCLILVEPGRLLAFSFLLLLFLKRHKCR